MSACLSSSRLRTTIRVAVVFRSVASMKALPNEPVPPVTRTEWPSRKWPPGLVIDGSLLDERALLDVDHPRVEDLLVHFEVVDQAQAPDDGMADQLTGDLAELDLHDDVVGAHVVGD